MRINLRPATLAAKDLLQHWDEQPYVVDSDFNDDWGWEVELDRTPQWKDKRLIFTGDLNLTPWSPYYKRLVEKTGLHNTKLGFGVEPSWIEPATHVHLPALIIGVIKLPIDHIFVSNDIKVVD